MKCETKRLCLRIGVTIRDDESARIRVFLITPPGEVQRLIPAGARLRYSPARSLVYVLGPRSDEVAPLTDTCITLVT